MNKRASRKCAINQFHIAAITEHFRVTVKKKEKSKEQLPLDQRLANYIVEGTRDGLVEDLKASAPRAQSRWTSSMAR